jgi:hypothetical protein
MPKYKPLPPLAELQERLSYDPDTGVFRWKVKLRGPVSVGDIAGTRHSCGYLKFTHKGRPYFCHRVAWLFAYGEDPGALEIDHANGDRSDNRIENLRLATSSNNQCNIGLRADNACGYKGVYWWERQGCWVAKVQVRGVSCRRVSFRSAEAAYEWTCAKRAELHSEFVNHGAAC